MKVVPQGAPVASEPANASAERQASARERAIAMLKQSSQPQNHTTLVAESAPQKALDHPLNPNKIAPEDMSAIMPKSTESVAQEPKDSSPEVATEPAKAPEESEELISSQYAILARKEKAMRQREAALKAKEAAIAAKEEAAKAPSTPSIDESKYVSREKLTSDPFGVLTDLGLTYEQLTDMAMNAPKHEQVQLTQQIKALQDEIKALRGETETTKKTIAEQQESQYKAGLNQIRMETKHLIDNTPDYEMIKETGSHEDVVDLINTTFKEDGVLMTVEEAAQKVESYLLEEALKLAKIKKIQEKFAPKAASEQKPAVNSEKPQLTTLTNNMSAPRKLSARERAILAFEGKLNKQ